MDKNPGRPEAAQARLEIARLAAFQGDTLLAKALREDDTKTRAEQARKAESQFIQAGVELEGAAKQLADMAASYKNPDADVEKKNPQGESTLQWTPLEAEASPDGVLGFTRGTWIFTGTKKDGSQQKVTGYYVTEWRRQTDGKYKFVLDIGGADGS